MHNFSLFLLNKDSRRMQNAATHQSASSHSLHCQQEKLPTLPAIPLLSEELIGSGDPGQWAGLGECEEKVIPGYNFESLFRKKSHIRLGRTKKREEERRSSLKVEEVEEARSRLKGHWSEEENRLYHWFLEIHHRHFILKHLRRTDKIFKSMANFIRTRQPEQCRSHHQKMEKKYLSFHRILTKLRLDHYSSHAPDLLRLELEQHGYQLADITIVSEQQLSHAQLPSPEPRSEEGRSQNSSHSVGDRQENSLLREDYEKGLDFSIKYS